jgi:hypothetical protein
MGMSGRVRWAWTVGVYLAVSGGAFALGSTGWPSKWFVAAADLIVRPPPVAQLVVTGAPAAPPIAEAAASPSSP